MFIVPLSGDKIQCTNGAQYTVLGFTNVKDQPAVYVQGPDVQTVSVPFSDIEKINNAPVKLTSGKIFNSAARPKHLPLPQRDDRVVYRNVTVKVDAIKANQHGHLAAGLLVAGVNIMTGEKVTTRLAHLVGIERANGNRNFDLAAFKKQYSEYLGAAK